MANWTNLKTAIHNVIYENTSGDISGNDLQVALDSIIDAVGATSGFKGIAVPSTSPLPIDGTAFYIATEAGTYANLGGTTISTEGIYIFEYNDSAWTCYTIYVKGISADLVTVEPTASILSTNVQDALAELDGEVSDLELKVIKIFPTAEIQDNAWQHFITGEITENSPTFFIAKGLVVSGNRYLLVSRPCRSADGAMGIVFYDSDGSTKVGGAALNVDEISNISIPNNAYYANISFSKEIYNSLHRFIFHLYDDVKSLDTSLRLLITANTSDVSILKDDAKTDSQNLLLACTGEKVSGGLDASGVKTGAAWTYMSERFIKIIPGSRIYYSLRTFSALAIAFYSADDVNTFISGVMSPSTNAFGGSEIVPANAYYMRFCSTDWELYYIYINNLSFAKSLNNINLKDVSLNKATITDGAFINSSGAVENYANLGYYTLPVVGSEKVLLYCGVDITDSSLCLAFYDENDVFISSQNLASYSRQAHSFEVPINARIMKVSFRSKYKDLLYCVPDLTPCISENSKKISDLQNVVGNSAYNISLAITSVQTINQTFAPFCNVTKSKGKKITGTGTTTLTLNFASAVPSGKVYSYGVKMPYYTQNVATIALSGGNAIGKPGTTLKTKSGKMYKMQGECYQRVNITSAGELSTDIVITTDSPTDNWELWVSESVIVNDNMPLAPICYIYDGGQWDGHVIYNSVEMSIWTLHRTLGIPYSIAATTAEDAYQQEVLDDIESGFAEIITRIGGRNNTLYQSDDASVISGIITECRDHKADNMGAVLSTHAFDKDVLRCVKMAGVEFLRTYPTYDDVEKYASRFSDYDLPLISGHSVSSDSLVPSTFRGFPIILWAHGVGDPQSTEEQAISSFYEDKTNGAISAGTYTISVMTKILSAQSNGNAAVMKASEWIAYCRMY